MSNSIYPDDGILIFSCDLREEILRSSFFFAEDGQGEETEDADEDGFDTVSYQELLLPRGLCLTTYFVEEDLRRFDFDGDEL